MDLGTLPDPYVGGVLAREDICIPLLAFTLLLGCLEAFESASERASERACVRCNVYSIVKFQEIVDDELAAPMKSEDTDQHKHSSAYSMHALTPLAAWV